MASATQTSAAKQGGKAAAVVRKFRSAVQNHLEQVTTIAVTPSATQATTSTFEIPAYGFLRALWLRVTVSGGVGTTTAAVYKQNAPYSWISNIQFLDVNSAPIVFQITGFDLYLIMKYGGYLWAADPAQSEEFTQGGAGGNAVFTLMLPLEVRSRDGLGSMPNTSSNTAYKVIVTVAATTDVFTTAPVPTLPTQFRMDVWQDAWWEPAAQDLAGRPQAQDPPSPNSTQYWSKSVISQASAGPLGNAQIKRLGYLHRNWILSSKDVSGARVTSQLPDPLTVIYEGQQMTLLDQRIFRHMIAKWYGYTAATGSAGGLDVGVFPYPFTRDFSLTVGAELGNAYLPTTPGTRLEFQGQMPAAGSIEVLINDLSAADELDITG